MIDERPDPPMEKIQRALDKAKRQREQVLFPGRRTASQTPATLPVDTAEAPLSGLPATRMQPVPAAVLKARRVIAGLDDMPSADAFRMLRTQVVQRLTALHASTLAITSPGVGEGKTLLAANLAIALSRFADRNVLLADFDIRRPAVHATFGLPRTPGLSDHLLAGTPLADCLINPGVARLSLLLCGTVEPVSSELLSSPRLAALAVELKTRYPDRIVVYDLPPLLVNDDALVALQHIDACLLVVEQGATQRDSLDRCLELLEGHTLIGTVLNKVRSSGDSYGYGYGYAP